jgi:hypothetical protein
MGLSPVGGLLGGDGVTNGAGRGRGIGESDAVLLVAGLADMAVGGLSTVVGGLRGLFRRADLAELADEGQQEIKARGRLALDRFAAASPAHLEVLAQQVKARRGPAGV